MCSDHGSDVAAAAPRAAAGEAVDPIHLDPVDEVVVTMLVDNSYDGLLASSDVARRAGIATGPPVPSDVMLAGQTMPGLVAEHGFSCLVTVRRGDASHTVLFDTGISPHGMAVNMERLGLPAGEIEAVVLSHGHLDHTGGLEGLAELRGSSGLPLVVHPAVWSRRRLVVPGRTAFELPTVSRQAVEDEGFAVIERRQPSLLLGGGLLVTGEIDRTTDFERGLPRHERHVGDDWEPDPLILDSQALVVHVRGRGLVVITGCGHAGAVNIVRHARRLTGVDTLHALLGGLHLSGPVFEPIIAPTVAALVEEDPGLLVPAHCTGWVAQHRLAAALPDAFTPNAVGTAYTIAA